MAERATILEQFKRLPEQQKLELIDELLLEAAVEIQARPLTDAERSFLDGRLADAELHQAEEREWTDFRDELLQNP